MRVSILALVVVLHAGLSLASVFPTSISREPLNVGIPSERLTVGLTYEDIKKGIDFNKGPDAILEAESLALYIGYDVLPWLTLFTTLGASEIDDTSEIGTDPKFKISGGASAYLWEGDILAPTYMAGRLTLKTSLEVSRYDSDSDVGSVDWIDVTLALPFGYERFDEYSESPRGIDTSLAIYIGPAISYIDGTWDTAVGDFDFEHKELFGVIGGVDIYISPGVSLGAQFSYFDETTVMGSVRFHL